MPLKPNEAELIPAYHEDCGGVAFLTVGRLRADDALTAHVVRYPDGRTLDEGDPCVCAACGEAIAPSLEVRYRDDA